ncbi:RtcB family protein [Hymenobacter rubripertinctus]|uniref:3'-phosphate/5'-hydroxy nucleic acid ligase n=1 Tax=Hymenobacter rubripertinctus TaxID=2029981 RepID=A0A418QVL4_9BACT|nr:RtcB family protein [Hymenobacter rubripertinctus]RIY09252.1 hypothetical protein D0T11_12505 [Hymenobacter rubripertinctus]
MPRVLAVKLARRHGAGRAMLRTRAKAELGKADLRRYLRQHQGELLGGGPDEALQVYKDSRQVMQSQPELVDVLGYFTLRIVRMEGAA